MAAKMKMKFNIVIILFAITLSLSGCLTSKKIDKFVGKQFNDELPKPEKKKNQDISITSNIQYSRVTYQLPKQRQVICCH